MVQSFIYIGVPKAQGRPKFFRRGNFTGAYDPKQSRDYKDNIAAQIVGQGPKLIDKGIPIELEIIFYLPRPKGHYNSVGVVKPRYESLLHTSKPDLDNMIKAIKDALKGIVWNDDSQICWLQADKQYSDRGKVKIRVWDKEEK